MDLLKAWFQRTFSDPQIIILGLFLLVSFLVVFGLGHLLWPVFASIIIAYLLEALVLRLEKIGLPRFWSVMVVFLAFLAISFFLLFGLVPMLSRQLTQLIQQIPNYVSQGQALLVDLPRKYPQLVSEAQIQLVFANIGSEVGRLGQQILGWSLASVASIAGLVVFLVLVPVLVFFFMKDKATIVAWFVSYLPTERTLVSSIWTDIEGQISNYIRGKSTEIIIVGAVSYITFVLFGLQYAALLATVVGFSVLIPYVGAFAVTIPVALVAYFQWGWSLEFAYVVIAYGIIQVLDGNVLVPLLFSEAVNLHPIAIIVAILIFGGLWGFWGIFFAIPLATVVQAILKAWPRHSDLADESASESADQ